MCRTGDQPPRTTRAPVRRLADPRFGEMNPICADKSPPAPDQLAIDTRIPRRFAIAMSARARATRRPASRARNTTRLPRGNTRAIETGSASLSSSVIKTSAGNSRGAFARALRRAASLASLPFTRSCLLQTHRTAPRTRWPPFSRASMRHGRPRLRPPRRRS